MREKPIVMPVLFGDEQTSVARKIYTPAPSMPAGTVLWVEVDGRWMRARVERIEFAVLHLVAPECPLMTGNGLFARASGQGHSDAGRHQRTLVTSGKVAIRFALIARPMTPRL